MVFTGMEILYFIVLVISIGFIFSGFIKRPQKSEDVLDKYQNAKKRFDLKNIGYSILVAAPAVLFHELAHKFVAMGFGLIAHFHIWWTGLGIGLLLRIFSAPFLLIAPGYVSTIGASAGQGAWIALAGPLVNGLFWLVSFLVLKYNKKLSRKAASFWKLTGVINKWLFIFNLIPIPPLDGYHVLSYFIGLF